MNSQQFTIWLKGFTEACNDLTATPKQWDHIKEVLNEVKDYNDNPGIDVEIDDYNPSWMQNYNPNLTMPSTGTVQVSGNTSHTVLNDKMGCWHYTNYPEGFGYFTNSTADGKKEKQQLND